MTIRTPKPNLADKFLKLLGKKRAVYLPNNIDNLGRHFYVIGVKEGFWKAITRPKNKELPEGTIDIFMVEELKQYKDSN